MWRAARCEAALCGLVPQWGRGDMSGAHAGCYGDLRSVETRFRSWLLSLSVIHTALPICQEVCERKFGRRQEVYRYRRCF